MTTSPFVFVGVLALTLGLSGCATVSAPDAAASTPAPESRGHPDDPWEGMNRSVFAFNEALDRWVLKPVATGYDAVAPGPVRVGVANFFSNLGDVWVGVNSLLQGKPGNAANDLGRFVVNSTMGVAGLIDVASPMGLARNEEDFGQTLAVWGVGGGPYMVLPVLGPRTLRDTGGVAVDLTMDTLSLAEPESSVYGLVMLRLIDTRAGLLPAEKVVSEAALDKYSYYRSAYLQRRQYLIFDGQPPREDFSEE